MFYFTVFFLEVCNFELLKLTRPLNVEFTKNGKPINFELAGATFYAEITDIKPNDVFLLKVVYPKWTYSEPLPPKHAIYDLLSVCVIKNFDDEIFINTDATVKVKRKYHVDFGYNIEKGLSFPFSLNINNTTPYFENFGTNNHQFIIEEVDPVNAKYYYSYTGFELNWGVNKNEGTRSGTFEFEYTTYNMLRKDGKEFFFNIPLYENAEFPVVKGRLRIHLPKSVDNRKLVYKLVSQYNREPDYKIYESGFIDTILQLDFELNQGVSALPNLPMLNLRFPKGNIKTSFNKDSLIFYDTHEEEIASLLAPLIITFILFVLWFFIGRDKRQEIIEKHYIPDEISPPEVGFIWDGKLHKRDLVALIYHWAAKGYLKIDGTDPDENNLTLIKLKNLPKKGSKNFELTIFNGLFKERESVKVAALRDSFYETMQSAGTQFENYSKSKKLIVPGTKAFGKALTITGIIAGSITFIIGLIYTSVFILVYSLLLTAPFLIFGRIMPRFGHLGAKLYHEVLGFRKFIEVTEVDRLMFLLEENPDYFDQTIAYAIVMGMGNVWAKKFDGLIKSGKLEESTTGNVKVQIAEEKLDTLLYVNTIIRHMHKIESDFHYKSAPTYSSGGSYSSSSYESSGSNSYSSSSSYGGSSSYGSSGSGYSGSGYGGGGGSSW